ncbi:hypothetical protein D3C86_1425360 [compost metagenome]
MTTRAVAPSVSGLSPKKPVSSISATTAPGSVIGKPDWALTTVSPGVSTRKRSPARKPWLAPPLTKTVSPDTRRISVNQARCCSWLMTLVMVSAIAADIARSFSVESYPARVPNPATSPVSVVASPDPEVEKKTRPVRTSTRRISTVALTA